MPDCFNYQNIDNININSKTFDDTRLVDVIVINLKWTFDILPLKSQLFNVLNQCYIPEKQNHTFEFHTSDLLYEIFSGSIELLFF